MLAQAADVSSVFLWGTVLILVLLAGTVLVQFVRKRIRDDDTAASTKPTGFTLTELRELHQSGQLSNEEFEKAKFAIVAAAKKTADRAAANKPQSPRPMLKDK